MNLRRTVRALWAATIVLGVAGAACADDTPVSAEQVNALLQRLQQAEARINSLQSELNGVKKEQAVVAEQVAPRLPLSSGVEGREVPAPSRSTLKGGATYQPTSTMLKEADDEMLGRLEKLETNWAKIEESQSKLSNAVLDGQSGADWKLEGRIHGDYWAFPGTDAGSNAFEGSDPQDRFTTRRARIGLKGKIKDNMEYVAQLEFAGVDDPEFRDLYIGWHDLPVLQTLLIGNQKRPYGLDHLNSSRYNVFLERPFIIEAFNEDARRIGIAAYGTSDDEAWNWRYGVYNMEKAHPDGEYIGDNYQLEVAGRLANTWWYDECSDGRGYGHWGVSGTVASPDCDGGVGHVNESRFSTRPEARTSQRWLNTGRVAGAENYGLLGLEGVFNVGPVQLVGEVQNVWMDREVGNSLHYWGGYAYVSYFLTGEHIPWERNSGTIGRVKPFENFFLVDTCDGCTGSGMGAWNVAARFSYADFNSEDILGGVGESLTLALNWHWNPNAKIQFNYIKGIINDRSAGLAASATSHYDIIGTRFTVDF